MASILSLDCWLVADQELFSEEELFFRIFAGVSELEDGLSLSGVSKMFKVGAVQDMGSLGSLDSTIFCL